MYDGVYFVGPRKKKDQVNLYNYVLNIKLILCLCTYNSLK